MLGKTFAIALILVSGSAWEPKPVCELDFCDGQFRDVFTRAGAIICPGMYGIFFATNDLPKYGGHRDPKYWEMPPVHPEFSPETPQYWGCSVYRDGVPVKIETLIGIRTPTVLTNLGWVWQIDLRN
jgi:hypothetical protein